MVRGTTTKFTQSTRSFLLVVSLSTVFLGSPVRAEHHEDAADPEISLKYRQSVMSIVGTNMGAIGDIMKNGLALPGAVANHAGQMADSAALIGPAFTHKVTSGATDAKADIWQDWAKFEEAIANFEEAARGLQTAAEGPDKSAVGPAMRALGKSCGGCHKPFRKPKEESYKNK